MKVAAIQMPTVKDKMQNIRTAGTYIEKIKAENPDFVILPEMFCCPYQTENFPVYAEKEGGPSWQAMSDYARKYHIYLIAGSMPEADDVGKVYNTAYIFDRDGKQIGKHRKAHLFDINVKNGQYFKESDTLTSGDHATVFDTEFGKMGVMICYDIRFPEFARTMVLDGARMIFVPAAFNMTTGPAHWELTFRARALDNQIYMLGCAPARDTQAGYISWGHSIVTDPWGKVMKQLDEKEGILIEEIDLDREDQIREQLPLLKHRKSEMYHLQENTFFSQTDHRSNTFVRYSNTINKNKRNRENSKYKEQRGIIMKYKHLAMLMGVMITATSVGSTATAFAADSKTESTQDADDTTEDTAEASDEKADDSKEETNENEILGEVKSVEDGKITIAVGTRKEMSQPGEQPQGGENSEAPEKPDGDDAKADGDAKGSKDADSEKTDDASTDESSDTDEETEDTESTDDASADNTDKGEAPDGNGDGQGAPDGEAPSMLDLTGEEQEITVTDSTVITKQSMGGGQGAPGGEAPEKPDGDNGETPEKPDGDNADDNADAKSEDTENTDDSEKTDASDDSESSDAEKTEKASDSDNTDSEATKKPEGEAPDGNGQAPDGADQTEEIILDDIKEGDVVAITLDDDGNAATITVQSMDMGGGQGGPGGQASGVDSYDVANEYSSDETVSDTTLESTGTDENAALVSNGAEVTFSNDAISRTSSDSQGGDNSSFYGVGAAVLATDGTAYVKGSTVTTDSKGGAGLFAYGDGTVYVADTDITTQQDTSGGIHAAGGGKLYAWDLNVETKGESSAAIRSDRGGGTMVVDGGTYTSNGVGSPAVYCTADIAVNNAELTANGSEAVCIEGLNSLRLYNSNLTGNMSDDEQNDTTWTVILYQSMSGDSEVGNSTFQMDGGTITSKNGGLFYTTNTECTITLKDVDITYNDDNEFFLQCTGNNNQRGWGQSGANGSDCNFTADSQDMKGNVIWDSISDLDFYMTNGSTLEGAFVNDESNAGNGGDGYCNVVIDKDSTWTVTGDSIITSLSNAGTITDADGKTVSIVGTDGTTYVEGDSDYTITVGSYQDSADTFVSTTVDDWSSYEVERPESL